MSQVDLMDGVYDEYFLQELLFPDNATQLTLLYIHIKDLGKH